MNSKACYSQCCWQLCLRPCTSFLRGYHCSRTEVFSSTDRSKLCTRESRDLRLVNPLRAQRELFVAFSSSMIWPTSFYTREMIPKRCAVRSNPVGAVIPEGRIPHSLPIRPLSFINPLCFPWTCIPDISSSICMRRNFKPAPPVSLFPRSCVFLAVPICSLSLSRASLLLLGLVTISHLLTISDKQSVLSRPPQGPSVPHAATKV